MSKKSHFTPMFCAIYPNNTMLVIKSAKKANTLTKEQGVKYGYYSDKNLYYILNINCSYEDHGQTADR